MEILSEGSILANSQRLPGDLNVAGHVRFLCQFPKTDMPFYYAASSIFVDPYIVGQGYASLEAVACEKQ